MIGGFTAGDRVRAKIVMARDYPDLRGDEEFESYVSLWCHQTRIGATDAGLEDFFDAVGMDTLKELTAAITADPTNAPNGAG